MDLFDHAQSQARETQPFAEAVRPVTLEGFFGQLRAIGPGKALRRAIERDQVPSLILWGPPGTGKTTLARIVAERTGYHFEPFSAVLGGVKEMRVLIEAARERRRLHGRRTILFVDEIHRFNKGQQDALLPHVEDGTVTLIGATTENPSFAVNAALLSRARVFRLEPLGVSDLEQLLGRALRDSRRGLGELNLEAEDGALHAIAEQAHGDARRALSVLEVCADLAHASGQQARRVDDVQQALSSKTLLYDKSGEEHYNVVSAFIKSMRGNDPDAAVYWLMRMLEAGEDPRFVLRRMLIFASEDIGNADPRALELAVAADQAFARSWACPRACSPSMQCCTYLASAPKSNASYEAGPAPRPTCASAAPCPCRCACATRPPPP
jgi:putative ATPase